MKKYNYHFSEGENVTVVRTYKVQMDKDLLPRDSVYSSMCPGIWFAIDNELNLKLMNFLLELENIKRFIINSRDLFIIYVKTESELPSGERRIRQHSYLTNRNIFIEITLLRAFTNLVGCRIQRISPPFEDFISDFISEKYF
jgi:hypothetical protein